MNTNVFKHRSRISENVKYKYIGLSTDEVLW